ncbi:MAG: DUF4340 domain-containing protein [Pseudomonadales bacterium]|nr:DUF4340 domain-containing protein [Pseudomonadales bacterium]
MLKRWNILLSVLLSIQLAVLFYFVNPTGHKQGQVLQKEVLLVVDRDALNKIVLEEAGGVLELNRKGSAWHLGSYFDLPVDEAQLNLFLDAIASWKPGFVYSDSEVDYSRFQVSEQQFRFRVRLHTQNNKEQVFLLGSFEGGDAEDARYYFRQVGEKPVYAVRFSGFLPSTLPFIWMDVNLLQVSDQLQHIGGKGFDFVYRQGVWRLSDLADAEKQDFVQVAGFIAAIQNLRVIGKLDNPEVEKMLSDRQPDYTFDIETVGGKKDIYRFFSVNGKFFVRSDRYPHFFYFSEQTAKLLQGLQRSSFLQK